MGVGTWSDEQTQFLRDLVFEGASFSIAAAEINARFNTSFTRNSTIGRAHRIGLCAARKPGKAKREKVARPKKVKWSDPAPVRPLRETIEIRCAEVEPLHLLIDDLQPHQCRYPYGDRSFTFCGRPAIEESSYCEPHRLLCTQASRPGAGNERTRIGFSFLLRKTNISKTQVLSSANWADEAA